MIIYEQPTENHEPMKPDTKHVQCLYCGDDVERNDMVICFACEAKLNRQNLACFL